MSQSNSTFLNPENAIDREAVDIGQSPVLTDKSPSDQAMVD
ncbi:hypothetical protein [Spirosoma spitsbergense]|nr:hypothetical protein [Spirosoma spitsbergense]